MRLLLITIALAVICGCAGFTVQTPHNEMFLAGDDSTVHPAITFGPSADALEGMSVEDRVMVLMEYAKAAGQWLTFAPSWEQRIGAQTETAAEASARFRAALAKEITGDTGTGDTTENVPLDGP